MARKLDVTAWCSTPAQVLREKLVHGKGAVAAASHCFVCHTASTSARWPGRHKALLPHMVRRVEGLALRRHGPGDMQELPGCCTPRHF